MKHKKLKKRSSDLDGYFDNCDRCGCFSHIGQCTMINNKLSHICDACLEEMMIGISHKQICIDDPDMSFEVYVF